MVKYIILKFVSCC